MNGIPNSTWQKNTDEAVFNIPANNSPICNITDKVMFAYSLRIVNANYNGPLIRVRRAVDNNELDIYADQFGKLDTLTLNNFCKLGTGFVTRWYDQSGFNRTAFQGTANSQPIIAVRGQVLLANGVPIIARGGSFGGIRFLQYNTTEFDWNDPMSVLITNQFVADTNVQTLLSFNSSTPGVGLSMSATNLFQPAGTGSSNPRASARISSGGALADFVANYKITPRSQLHMIYLQLGNGGRAVIDTFGNGIGARLSYATVSIPSSSLTIGSGLSGFGLVSEVFIFSERMNPSLNSNNHYNYDETLLNIVKNVGKYHSIGLPF